MATTALVIEDDEAAARLLVELCAKAGVEATFVRNGKEGLEKAKALAPDLVLLDLLVPGLDGFKVAEGLRAANLPSKLIVVSGVYKDPKVAKEFADKYGADFFLKPFKPDELLQAIARKLGLTLQSAEPAPVARRASVEVPATTVGPMEGSLRTRPLPALLMELARAKASGTLDLERGQMKKRIFMNRGFVRFAQSNIKSENVGGMQVAEGRLTEAQFATVVARARDERIGIGEALALAALITRDELGKAMRRQVEEVVVTAFPWTDATFRYAPGDTDRVQDARHNPVALLLTAYKRFVTPEQALAQLRPLEGAVLTRGADFDRELFAMRGVFGGETLTPMINGRQKVSEIAARARKDDLPLLLALVQLGLTLVAGAPAHTPAAGSP
ncbi:MAG: response regulator, partial [Myxococcales bacterium]